MSKNDSKLYTDFEFCEGKNINIQKHIDIQNHVIYVDKFFFKKSLHILEDGASGVQVYDIKHGSV